MTAGTAASSSHGVVEAAVRVDGASRVVPQPTMVVHHDVEPDMLNLPRKIPMKIEPRSFLGNERTFLAWVHMAVAFGGTSAALTSLCINSADIDSAGPISPRAVEQLGMFLAPASLVILGYGLFLFLHRNQSMNRKAVIMYDDRIGIIVLTSLICCMLITMTFVAYYSFLAR